MDNSKINDEVIDIKLGLQCKRFDINTNLCKCKILRTFRKHWCDMTLKIWLLKHDKSRISYFVRSLMKIS